MEALARDLKYAIRSLRSDRSFSLLAILTLALGIGATTSIFSVVNSVVLAPLPYGEPRELVHVRTDMTDGRQTTGGMPPFAFVQIKEGSTRISDIAGAFRLEVAIRDLEDRPIKTAAYIVTEGYFDVFGRPMAAGRGFLDEEHVPGDQLGVASIVLSHRIWQSAFNGDPSIVGRAIATGDGSFTVVGVAPEGFDYPADADVWVAVHLDATSQSMVFDAVARLAPGATLPQARDELSTMARRFEEDGVASWRTRTMIVEDLQASIVGDTRTTLLILFGAAVTLLLIACANVMNLLLSRGAGRARELALRSALGASRGRLLGQLLTESLTLAAAGALVGLLAAFASVVVLRSIGPAELPRMAEVGIDATVLLFTVGATGVTGLLFGLLPAVRLVLTDIRTLMGGSTRGAGSRGAQGVFNVLVLIQTGMAVALVIGAGLLVRSFQRLQSADPGYDVESVVVMDVNLPGTTYPSYDDVERLHRELLDAVANIPGVESVGAASALPAGPALDVQLSVTPEGSETSDAPERARLRSITSGFVETLGVDLVEGRTFTPDDRSGSNPVMVVNREFVRRVLGGEAALGRMVRIPSTPLANPSNLIGLMTNRDWEIVGVVDDINYATAAVPVDPAMYLPHPQATFRRLFVTARFGDVDPGDVIAGMRQAFQDVDRTLPVEFTTLQDLVDDSLGTERLAMLLLLAFGLSAATLAAVGIYGVISYGVQQRIPEMAIRAALGAEAKTVLWLSMSRGVVLAGVGIAVGIVIALVGRSLIATQLYEVSATDPVVMVGAPALLGVVAFLAVLMPALRATRINLSHTLRTEA